MNKIIYRLTVIAAIGLLLFGYLILFVVSYGTGLAMLPEIALTALIWTYLVYFLYKGTIYLFLKDSEK